MTDECKKGDVKICGVCGDRALGCNFNAVTCESCKAFFRRNALKTKDFKCPFNDNCSVDVITRRFCQKCRLKKCFDIGMKKEWIMTDEEKKVKRAKIEENRHKKHSPGKSIDVGSVDSPPTPKENRKRTKRQLSLDDSSPHPPKLACEGYSENLSIKSEICSSVYSDSESQASDTMSQGKGPMIPSPLNEERCKPTSTLVSDLIKASSPASYSGQYDSLPTPSPQSPDNEGGACFASSSFKINEEYVPSKSVLDIAVENEFTPITIRNSNWHKRELSQLEQGKLDELVVACEVLNKPAVCGSPEPSLLDVINMTDYAIRRLIKMSKKINGFKNLCQEDQIALLKGGCLELMILRSAMSYDPEKNCWQGLQDQLSMSIKVDVLKKARGNMYEEHKRFITSFDPTWRKDEKVMLLLSAITLFTPTRANTVHRDVIHKEQHLYYYLLKRYLETKQSGCKANSAFLQLIEKLHQLHALHENHTRVFLEFNPKDVEPLLIEIFDLKHLNSTT